MLKAFDYFLKPIMQMNPRFLKPDSHHNHIKSCMIRYSDLGGGGEDYMELL